VAHSVRSFFSPSLFKKDEIDSFMEKCRVECFDIKKEAERVMKSANRSRVDVNKVIKKAIEEANGKRYTSLQEKPGRIKGLRKEVEDGII